MNAAEIEAAISDVALQPFNPAQFPFAFLAAFGNKSTSLKRLRTGNNNGSNVSVGVPQRNNVHLTVCEADAIGETLKALRAGPATTKANAKPVRGEAIP
ncbi:MAG: type IIL restriction-modification enzyme MmeI [Burkholderiales bacterium]